ncbi:MAG: lytic transglycosylase domain-containing protein, partial [Myxococcota bacterium]
MPRFLRRLLASLLLASAAAATGDGVLPRPVGLEPAIRFWLRIYTEVESSGGVIHDSRNLEVVYETLSMPSGTSTRALERRSEERKREYRKILERLARGKRSELSAEEERVLSLWPPGVSNQALKQASRRLRFQLGQADRFRRGLIRSGAWREHIQQTLGDHGVPPELVALPHVESSYNPAAYSRVGAAGLWQFTRSTGRRFLRVDSVVDERLDPHKASVAAARLLQENYKLTGTWPL